MPSKLSLDKSGFLHISSHSDKQWKWQYLSVKGLYLKISDTKDIQRFRKEGDPDKPRVRSSIKKAFQYDTAADPRKFKIEFDKGNAIFLKAKSEEDAKEWIHVLMQHNGPPTEMEPGGDPLPYDDAVPQHHSLKGKSTIIRALK